MSLFEKMKPVTIAPKATKRKASIDHRLVDIYKDLSKLDFTGMYSHNLKEWRDDFYSTIENKIVGINYTQHDIQDLVFNFLDVDENNLSLRGFYVGALISYLTEWNPKEQVEVELDLENNQFDLLCYAIRSSDSLRISRIKGDKILYFGGCFGGNIGNLEVLDSQTENLASHLAKEGFVDKFKLVNIKAKEEICNYLAYSGRINSIELFNTSSKRILYFPGINGFVGEIIIDDCHGALCYSPALNKGEINLIHVINSSGDSICTASGSNGRVGIILVEESNFDEICIAAGVRRGLVDIMLVKNSTTSKNSMFERAAAEYGKVGMISVKKIADEITFPEMKDVKVFDREGKYFDRTMALVEEYKLNPKTMDLDSEIKELLASVNGGER